LLSGAAVRLRHRTVTHSHARRFTSGRASPHVRCSRAILRYPEAWPVFALASWREEGVSGWLRFAPYWMKVVKGCRTPRFSRTQRGSGGGSLAEGTTAGIERPDRAQVATAGEE
jgi:hypothetical protein